MFRLTISLIVDFLMVKARIRGGFVDLEGDGGAQG
jgi:hypothetical protein